MRVPLESNRPSAVQLREQQKARWTLERLERMEDLAGEWEREAVPRSRKALAEQYQRAAGIHPSRRAECREALACIQRGARQTVANLLAILKQDYSVNGPLESDGWASSLGRPSS